VFDDATITVLLIWLSNSDSTNC